MGDDHILIQLHLNLFLKTFYSFFNSKRKTSSLIPSKTLKKSKNIFLVLIKVYTII